MAEEGNDIGDGYVEVFIPDPEVSEDESDDSESTSDYEGGDDNTYIEGDYSYNLNDDLNDVNVENDEVFNGNDANNEYEDQYYDEYATENEVGYNYGENDFYDEIVVDYFSSAYVPYVHVSSYLNLDPFILTLSGDVEVIFDMQDDLVLLGPLTGTTYLQEFGSGMNVAVNEATVAGETVRYIQVLEVNDNGQGLTILTSDMDLEEGDRLIVTGRPGANFPDANRSMMLRRSVGIDWNDQQLNADNDPQPTFSLSHIISAAELAPGVNIHIHANTWGAPGLDNSVFYIDSIIITRDLGDVEEDDREVIYSLTEDAYIQSLTGAGPAMLIQPFTTTNLAGTPYLQPSGGAVITVYEYDDVNFLHVGGRSNDWDGLDLMFDPMDLLPGNVYHVRVSGRIDGTAPAGASIMLQGIPGHDWTNNTNISSNESFVLTHTLSASNLDNWDVIRITTNSGGASMSFYIHTIEFGTELPADLPFTPPGLPGAGDALYSLANHTEFQDLDIGDIFTGVAPLQGAGTVTLTVVDHATYAGNAISLTGRGDQNWHSLDVLLGSENVNLAVYNEYSVTVEGRVIGVPPAGAEVFLQGAANPWPFLAGSGPLTEDGTFTLTAYLDASNLPNIGGALRIQTNGDGIGMSFIIDDIEIVLEYAGEPEEEPENGYETVLYRLSEDADVQALSASASFAGGQFNDVSPYLISSANPTITVVDGSYGNALQITDRPAGTGEWYGIDILFNPMGLVSGAVYEFRAWGSIYGEIPISEGTPAMQFAQPNTPWGGYAGHVATLDNGEWTLTLRLSGALLNSIITGQTQPGVRIATNVHGRTMSFIIDEIEVVMIGDPEVTFILEHQITFDDASWAAYQDYLSAGDQMTGTRVTNRGNSDNYSFRLENTTGNFYSGQGNYLRFDLPENIPNGTMVRISWDVFVPSGENPDATTIVGPGLVINSFFGTPDYQPTNTQPEPGDLGGRTTPMDEWFNTTVEFMVNHEQGGPGLNHLIFRFRVNNNTQQPVVLYIDNINVYVGGTIELTPPEWDLGLPSLAELFEPWFLLGNIFPGTTSSVMNQFNTREMFAHHFNAITGENHHKPDQIAGPGSRITVPTVEEFDFTHADAVVDFAIENDITLVGHAFVWHSQSPNWLFLESVGEPLTRQQARDNMEFYIRTVSEHYAERGLLGAFYSWDVANEVIASGGGTWTYNWKDQIRSTGNPWLDAYANNPNPQPGDHPTDYIYDAFVFARRYFPYSILYYNDYNEEIPAKRDAIAAMVEYFNARWAHDLENNYEAVSVGTAYNGRLLIEAIGMQSHYHLSGWETSFDNVRPAIQRFIQTGARVSITELDITVGGFGGPAPDEADLPELFAQQAATYARLFGYYLEFADYIGRVAIWGLADNQSWRAAGHPLLFDANFDAKPAFQAIVDVAESATRPTVNPPTVTTAPGLPDGELGVRYTTQLSVTRNNNSPLFWEVSGGNLPPGLVLHSRTGVIEGVPTQNGTFTFTVRISNYGGYTYETFTIVIGEEEIGNQNNNQQVTQPPPATTTTTTQFVRTTGSRRPISPASRPGGGRVSVDIGAGIVAPNVQIVLMPVVTTSRLAGTFIASGETTFTIHLTYETGAILSGSDIVTLVENNRDLHIQSGRFTVTFTVEQMTHWNVNDEITIIVNRVDVLPRPTMPLLEFVEVIVLINQVEVSGLGAYALVSIDISDLNLTPEELDALSAVIFDPYTGQYTIIMGGFPDGNMFIFPISGPGLFGVVVVGLEVQVPTMPIVALPIAIQPSLRFVIGSTSFMQGDIALSLDAAPFIDPVYNRTMLPLAGIASALGANVQWVEYTRTVVITRDSIVVTLQVDTPLPNNMGMPVIIDGRTFVPIAYIIEALGANVMWDDNTQAIYVTN